MVAEPRSLLELLVAVVDFASVWKEVCVGVHMLSHVLLLCKPTKAYLTLVLLVVLVSSHVMPLQAEP